MKAPLALVFAIVLGLLAGPAVAAPAAKAPPPGSSVEMPYLVAPMATDEGRLAGYAYISIKLVARSPNSAVKIRGKVPFIQDAFVRDVNRDMLPATGDPAKIDRAPLAARLLADARRIAGTAEVVSLEIIRIQVTTLRDTPQG
ncbi:MAG: hypothetical protein J0I02_00580 [Alphaproteobacteria bacterium]|nr:hypothetical protein [Alphaproteobacteria bacterium]MBN9590711.1 hypothetical protein [Alphaproteobacteria bacterium]